MRTATAYCPHCLRSMPKVKAIGPAADVDTLTLPELEARKHLAKIAPYEDLRAFIERASMSESLKAKAYELATHVNPDGKISGMGRTDFYRAYFRLTDTWRIEAKARTAAWYAAFEAEHQNAETDESEAA